MKIKYLLAVAFFGFTISLTACRQLDVIGNKSITSFEEILQAIPDFLPTKHTAAGL